MQSRPDFESGIPGGEQCLDGLTIWSQGDLSLREPQVELTRTSTPRNFAPNRETNHPSYMSRRLGTPLQDRGPAKRRRIDSLPRDNTSETKMDACHRLTSQTCQTPPTGFPRRRPSLRLRPKSSSTDLTLCNMVCVVKLLPEEMDHLLRRAEVIDPHLKGGEVLSPLDFKCMSDVTAINERLHEAVETWMAKENLKVDVDFTLARKAKGKEKA